MTFEVASIQYLNVEGKPRSHEVECYLLNCSVHGISLRFLLSNNSSAKKIQLTNHTPQGAVKGIICLTETSVVCEMLWFERYRH